MICLGIGFFVFVIVFLVGYLLSTLFDPPEGSGKILQKRAKNMAGVGLVLGFIAAMVCAADE